MVALGRIPSSAVAQPCAAALSSPDVRAIFDQQAAFVWRSLRRLGVPSADLEDATQEVFMVVHTRLAEYQERAAIRSWLYAICMRVSSSHRRRLRRRRETVVPETPEVFTPATQQHSIEQQEALVLGERLLEALPEKQRAVFILYDVEHMSMAEVAAAVGCPVQTAYARLYKAPERVLAEVTRLQRSGRLP
jgi:RNA polymerase sigma-70 factor, ECF subfamily